MPLTSREKERWSRQIALPLLGEAGQERLKKSRIAVFGVGGVGCAAALYLAAAGVRKLVLVDQDTVSLSNLNRQIIYGVSDLGRLKADVAAEHLWQLDPALEIEAVARKVNLADIRRILVGCDFAVDAFDRMEGRLAINQASVEKSLPAVHGFVQEMAGEVILVKPSQSACLKCFILETPPEPDSPAVLGVAAGMIGIAMASMAIKFLSGYGIVREGRRMFMDFAVEQYLDLPLRRRPECPVCGAQAKGG